MNTEQLGLAEIASLHNLRAYAAELIGTMLFVLIGTGAVIATGGGDLVAIALAHGVGIAVMVYATANYSGGHLNPAVTLAMIVTRRIKPVVGVAYIVAQMVGACLATALLYAILFNEVGELTNFGAHGINELALGNGGGFLLELLLTAALVAVIFATAVSRRGFGASAPLAIGLTVVIIHLIAVPLTGASVNPARTFGPALISNAFDSFWVYVIGPAAGAVVAAVLYHHVFLPSDDPEEASADLEESEQQTADGVE
ncbi:MAG: MIP family channel protein [Chloroflexi bacterium]|nr:MIP family channel protein [Chloroflexota bacterium]MYF80804.1 MIP family channel protein [Chloroflexota bacterium]MYI04025.1 MIP family channel protein [Chloroflexota bacterium]